MHHGRSHLLVLGHDAVYPVGVGVGVGVGGGGSGSGGGVSSIPGEGY